MAPFNGSNGSDKNEGSDTAERAGRPIARGRERLDKL